MQSYFRTYTYRSFSSAPPYFYPHSHSKTSGSGSPDSMLKKSLLPASSLYPTTSSTTSCSQTDCSSLSTENNRQGRTLDSIHSKGRLTKTTSLISPSIELISRGLDGRFALGDYDTVSVDSKKISRVRRSVSLHLEKENKKDLPYVLSVEVPPFKPEDESSRMCSLGQLRPLQESYIGSHDPSSLYSNTSLCTMSCRNTGLPSVFPVLPHLRASLGQPSTTASTLVLQMEHEREKGNLSRCLRLAQEREEMERELRLYTLERNSMKVKTEETETNNGEESVRKLMWEHKSKTLPNNYRRGGRERSSYLTTSSANWEADTYDSSSTLNPFREHLNTMPPLTPSISPYFHESFIKHSLPRRNGASHPLVDRSTLHNQSYPVAGAQGYANPRQFTPFDQQTIDSFSKPLKEKVLSNGTNSTRLEEVLTEPIGKESCVEMSVDEPEVELPTLQPTKPMLHHRIASHLQRGCSLSQRSKHEDMRRSTSLNCSRNTSVGSFDRVHYAEGPPETKHWGTRTRGSKTLDRKQRSQSLDLRRQKKNTFLNPEAWIDSLSQENCSVEFSETTTKNEPHFPPSVGYLSPSPSQVQTPNPDVPYCGQPSPSADTANHPTPFQDAMKQSGYIVSLKEVSTYLPPIKNELEALEVESGSYEGVPELGGSYSSYASSGRGSMETTNGQLNLRYLSPTLSDSPETAEDTQGRSEDQDSGLSEVRPR